MITTQSELTISSINNWNLHQQNYSRFSLITSCTCTTTVLNTGWANSPQVNVVKQVQFFHSSPRFPSSLSVIALIQEWKCLQNSLSLSKLIYLFKSRPDWYPRREMQTALPPCRHVPHPCTYGYAKGTHLPHCLLALSKHSSNLLDPKLLRKKRDENSED